MPARESSRLAFKMGLHMYVRSPDGVGYVFDQVGFNYKIALVDRAEEVIHPASKLTLWEPLEGEAVAPADGWPHEIEPVWSKD
jgi:hypothetical protein